MPFSNAYSNPYVREVLCIIKPAKRFAARVRASVVMEARCPHSVRSVTLGTAVGTLELGMEVGCPLGIGVEGAAEGILVAAASEGDVVGWPVG
jgi:hypothetical protein